MSCKTIISDVEDVCMLVNLSFVCRNVKRGGRLMNKLSWPMCMLIRLAVLLFVSVVTCPKEQWSSLSLL